METTRSTKFLKKCDTILVEQKQIMTDRLEGSEIHIPEKGKAENNKKIL